MHQPAGDLSPILTAHLFPRIESSLIELLRSLSAEEWQMQTVSPRWKVKDVAAHLLDTQLRKLSLVRDGCAPELPAAGPPTALINRLNEEGVAVYGRVSPRPDRADGIGFAPERRISPVARSLRGGGVSRELGRRRGLEKLVRHGARIHRALAPSAANPAGHWTAGYHDSRALPPGAGLLPAGAAHTYRNVPAEKGTLLRVDIAGDCGGTWQLVCEPDRWRLVAASAIAPACRVSIRRKLRGAFLPRASIGRRQRRRRGWRDRQLAEPMLSMVAIVA